MATAKGLPCRPLLKLEQLLLRQRLGDAASKAVLGGGVAVKQRGGILLVCERLFGRLLQQTIAQGMHV